MRNWYNIFPKNTSLNIYIWIIFCMLPFYFIFRASSWVEISIGVAMILLFFIAYRLTFLTKGWVNYIWVGIAIAISIVMSVIFGFVYFALFLAFMVGNIQHKVGFFILYGVLVLTTIATVNIAFFTQDELFFSQFPFVLISVIGVILLPLNSYNRNKRDKLEGQLEDANKRISQLIVIEERQRIARDLHDTLGQKLSLIGLKSDLAGKLLPANIDGAKKEIHDINSTARTALKEVRELVTDMRSTKLADEMIRVKQILAAAGIGLTVQGDPNFKNTPLLVENVLSMCLKEAITNVVKHSQATECKISVKQTSGSIHLSIQDNGIGLPEKQDYTGNGLRGMKERLEFVNGTLKIDSKSGALLSVQVPSIIKERK
ncbi:sensor histidine kinase [Jeotgalibacillus proteolyticus]|uniref:histidine kinase n=1 Tax=Jeotgalibacillus proteolyticus TaxID=2082395 RepID=A0A2S5GCL3_9BACL|nr:sensor histidine kinase [Jeotgalibacillus proteolyticus]PPA70777.1 sensor histidine kinase [Jeotgalibacillus proteolyticus]